MKDESEVWTAGAFAAQDDMSSKATRRIQAMPLRHVQARDRRRFRRAGASASRQASLDQGEARRLPLLTHRDPRLLPECGSPLFLQYDNDDLIRVTVGSLDRPEDVQPAGHYGVESRVSWADIGAGLPEEETKEKF